MSRTKLGIIDAINKFVSVPIHQVTAGNLKRDNRKDTATDCAPIVPQCNICGDLQFVAFAGRDGEQCRRCGALRRHRMAYALYTREGVLSKPDSPLSTKRVLHLAPETVLSSLISEAVGAGYTAADANPKAYKIPCLKLTFPEDFAIFPDQHFDFILHNHVMEHIPGSFRDHLKQFCRMLKPGGCMIFSVPGPTSSPVTIEGGEHLSSDAERLAKFGQHDHLKLFGKDLAEYLESIPGGHFAWDGLTTNQRAQISIGARLTMFLLWRRHP